MSGVLQGFVSGPVLLSAFINHLEKEIDCTLSRFADYTRLGGRVDSFEIRKVLQI